MARVLKAVAARPVRPQMRRPTFVFVLIACAVALSAISRAQAPGPTSPSVTSISGRVLDGVTGAPVSGAVVRIGGTGLYDTIDDVVINIEDLDRTLWERKLRTEVRTDRFGRFAFTDLPPGSYGIVARMDGWSPGRYGATASDDRGQSLDVSAGQRATATIAMWKEPWIGGSVVDDRGEPVERAEVQVLKWRSLAGRPMLTPVARLTTNDRGEYGGGVPPGEYIVRALSDQTRVRAWTALDVPLSGFPPVFYPSAASAEEAEPIRLTSSARLTSMNFRLLERPMRRLAGRLTNPSGLGSVPTSITLISQDGLEARVGASVDPQGRFLFERLFAGRYLLEATSSRDLTPGPVPMMWARAMVDVQDTDGVVTLTLRRGLIVRGRLEFDGTNPPPAEMLREFSVFLLEPPGEMGDVVPPRVQVQTDGTFAMELPGGEYLARVLSGFNIDRYFEPGASSPSDAERRALNQWRVRSAFAKGRDIVDGPLVLTTDVSDVVVTLSRDRKSVRGQVRLSRPQDYRVVLVPAESSLWPHSTGRRFVTMPVSSDGRFNLPAPPGDYLVGAVRGLPGEWRDGDLISQLASGMRGIHISESGGLLPIEPPAFDMPTGRLRGALPTTPDAGIDRLSLEVVQSLPLPALTGAIIAGRVVSSEGGQPLANVRVSAYPSVRSDVFTDAEGRFILQRVQSGSRTFHASKRGWLEASGGKAGLVLVVNTDRVDDVVIRMTPTAEITGAVHDQDGTPVEGMGVRAWRYQPGRDAFERTHRGPDMSSATDEHGQYRLAGMPPGRYLVSTTPYIARDEMETPVTTDDDLDRAAGRAVPPGRPRAQPSAHGYPAVFNGNVADSASAVPFELTSGMTRHVDLDVRYVPLSTVVITLRTPDSAALSNLDAHLEVSDRLVRSFSQLSQYPDRKEGDTLIFENRLPGRYDFGSRVRPASGPHYSAFADVVVTEGERQALTLDMMPGATVSGRVTIDGAPPSADAVFSIRAFDISGRMSFGSLDPAASLAEDGTFRIWSLVPGRYRFSLTRQGRVFDNVPISQIVGGRDTLHAGLEISDAQPVTDIQLAVVSAGVEVTGVVRDPAGQPVPGATVVVFPANRENWQPRSPHVASVRTDRQGRFVLKNVPPGECRIVAAALPPDVWLDAELLSTLFERSVPARTELSRALAIDLTMP